MVKVWKYDDKKEDGTGVVVNLVNDPENGIYNSINWPELILAENELLKNLGGTTDQAKQVAIDTADSYLGMIRLAISKGDTGEAIKILEGSLQRQHEFIEEQFAVQ